MRWGEPLMLHYAFADVLDDVPYRKEWIKLLAGVCLCDPVIQRRLTISISSTRNVALLELSYEEGYDTGPDLPI